MTPIEQLISVLCDPSGKCCIHGSEADRQIVDSALAALRAAIAQPVQPTFDLEANERAYTAIIGERSYQEVADALKRLDAWEKNEPVAWMTHANDTLPLLHKTLAGALGWGAEPTPLYTKPKETK